MSRPNFSGATAKKVPFPHLIVPSVLSEATAEDLLDWLDIAAPWTLRITDFYEQHEFSLLHCDAPPAVAAVVADKFVAEIARALETHLGTPPLALVEVAVHRLVEGQTIRIHNDHIGPDETHRLVVQLNRGWSTEQGGLFLIFGRNDPESVADVMLPVNRSGFGFEISEQSHHAVSTIHRGSRDTLVYTFRAIS